MALKLREEEKVARWVCPIAKWNLHFYLWRVGGRLVTHKWIRTLWLVCCNLEVIVGQHVRGNKFQLLPTQCDLWKVKFDLDIAPRASSLSLFLFLSLPHPEGHLTQVDAQTSVRAAYCIRRISFVSPSGSEWSLDLILFFCFVLAVTFSLPFPLRLRWMALQEEKRRKNSGNEESSQVDWSAFALLLNFTTSWVTKSIEERG